MMPHLSSHSLTPARERCKGQQMTLVIIQKDKKGWWRKALIDRFRSLYSARDRYNASREWHGARATPCAGCLGDVTMAPGNERGGQQEGGGGGWSRVVTPWWLFPSSWAPSERCVCDCVWVGIKYLFLLCLCVCVVSPFHLFFFFSSIRAD